MNLKLKENEVVYCPNKDQTIAFLKWLDELGYTWCSGDSYDDVSNWEDEKENTCYSIVKGQYGTMEHYMSDGKIIVSLEDFLEQHSMTIIKEDEFIPFNLKDLHKGEVVTKRGTKVEIIKTNFNKHIPESDFNILAIRTLEDSSEQVSLYTEDGRYSKHFEDSLDLHIRVNKYKVVENVKEITLEEIEEKLGYKIKIVNNDGK